MHAYRGINRQNKIRMAKHISMLLLAANAKRWHLSKEKLTKFSAKNAVIDIFLPLKCVVFFMYACIHSSINHIPRLIILFCFLSFQLACCHTELIDSFGACFGLLADIHQVDFVSVTFYCTTDRKKKEKKSHNHNNRIEQLPPSCLTVISDPHIARDFNKRYHSWQKKEENRSKRT